MTQIKIISEIENDRLDAYISATNPSISRSYAQKLISSGCVTVNGILVPGKHKLRINDVIELSLPEVSSPKALPEDIDINVIFEDKDILVVDKPKGMVVHPAAGNSTGTLVNALLSYSAGRLSSINGVERPGIVHRIDKNTSGILIVTKTDFAHEYFSRLFKIHDIKRIYLGLVEGVIDENKGKIDAPIARDKNNRIKMAVSPIDGKNAVTHFEVLERYSKHTLIKVELETGRTHQIRVHMAYIGHPLLGDDVYGSKKQKEIKTGQSLHAGTLGFVHPVSNEYMEFSSNPPIEFTEAVEFAKGL